MMNDDCKHHLGEDLAAMADGGEGLSDARHKELQTHVDGCEDCKTAIKQTKQIFESLSTPGLEPSQEFDTALFSRLDSADAEARGTWLERVQAWLTLPRFALGAGLASAAAIVFAIWVPRQEAAPQAAAPMMMLAMQESAVLENLDLLEELDLYDNLDVLEDLDVIEAFDEGEPG